MHIHAPPVVGSKHLFNKSLILYLPKVATGVLGSLAMAFILRKGGAGVLGELVIVCSYWGFISLLGANAIGIAMQRQFSISEVKTPERSARLMKDALLLQLVFSLITAALGGTLYVFVMSWIYKTSQFNAYLLPGIFLYIGSNFISFFRFALRGLQMFKTISVMDTLESTTRNVVWIIAVLLNGGVLGLLLGHIIASSLSTLFGMIILSQGLFRRPGDYAVSHKRRILRESLSFSSVSVSAYFMFTFPNLIMAKYLGSEAVGLFSGIIRIGDTIVAPMTSIGIVFAPSLTQAEAGDQKQFHHLLEKSFKLVVFFALVIGLVIANSEDLFKFFFRSQPAGESFIAYGVAMYAFTAALHGTFGVYLDFLGFGRLRAWLLTGFCLLNITVTYFASKYFNVVVATFAYLGVFLTLTFALLWIFTSQYSTVFISKNLKFLRTVLVAAVPAILIAKFIVGSGDSDSVINLIVHMGLRSVVYLGIAGTLFLFMNPQFNFVFFKKKTSGT